MIPSERTSHEIPSQIHDSVSMKWAVHPRFPSYRISDRCEVFRTKDFYNRRAGGLLKGRVLESGYRQFKLRDESGIPCFIRAARLMLESFISFAPSDMHQAAHYDGDRLNDRIENLRWATQIENDRDKLRHGTLLYGEKHPQSRMTDAVASKIRRDYRGKRGDVASLARNYSFGTSTVSRIVHGKSWLPPGRSALDQRKATP